MAMKKQIRLFGSGVPAGDIDKFKGYPENK